MWVHGRYTGYVFYEYIPKYKYLWYKYMVWIVLDDEANADTYNAPTISDAIDDESLADGYLSCDIVGSAFELGDKRAECSNTDIIREMKHIVDYTQLNLYYMLFYTNNRHDLVSFKIGNRKFSYVYVDMINNKDVFKLKITTTS
jgi:hypothetical protein